VTKKAISLILGGFCGFTLLWAITVGTYVVPKQKAVMADKLGAGERVPSLMEIWFSFNDLITNYSFGFAAIIAVVLLVMWHNDIRGRVESSLAGGSEKQPEARKLTDDDYI
jgi:type II secretory pathway component PulF